MHDSSREAYEGLLQWHSGSWCLRLWFYGNMKGKIVTTEKQERYSSWPFREGLPFHVLLPWHPPHLSPQSTNTWFWAPNSQAWEHKRVHTSRAQQTLGDTPYRKVSENQTRWTECFLMAVWHKVIYSWETVLLQRQNTGPGERDEVKIKLASHHSDWEQTGLDGNSVAETHVTNLSESVSSKTEVSTRGLVKVKGNRVHDVFSTATDRCDALSQRQQSPL